MNKFLKSLQVLAIVMVAGLLAVGGVSAVLAATDSPSEDALKISLAKHLNEHPNDQLALLLAQIVLNEKAMPDAPDLSFGIAYTTDEVPTQSICFKDSDNKFRCMKEGWEEMEMPTASTTVSEQNLLDFGFYIDRADIIGTGTVSSSMGVCMGTSTSGFVGFAAQTGGATNPAPCGIIQFSNYVTSTNQIQFVPAYRHTVFASTTPGYYVATSTYVTMFKQSRINIASTSPTGVCDLAGVQCEPVTSTNGMPTLKGHYHYRFMIDL